MDGRVFLPTVAWSFKVRNVIFLTPATAESPATFRCTAIPFDSSEPGANAGTKEIGFYVTDNVGNIYTVIATGAHTVDVSDDFRCGVGPQTGKWAVLSKSVDGGDAPFLTPIHYRRLDKSAIDNVRRIELAILYHKKVTIHADSSLIATIDENQVLKIITTEASPPVTINPDSVNLAEIGADQVLRIIPPISTSSKYGILEGGIVTWLYGLTFSLSLTRYYIDGVLYLCPSTIFTLDAADTTNPRIDVPTVTILGTVAVVKGTPAENPLQPSIDIATQLELPFILLPANATEPVGVTDAIVYDENNEWTPSAVGVTVDFNNTTLPFHGTKCASVGIIGNNDTISFTSGTPLNVADYETLSLFLKLKAIASSKNAVYIQFRLNGVAITQELPISWLITDITNWQNIALKLSDFAFNQSIFDAIRIRWSLVQPNTTTHAGFYLDYIKLQTGLTAPEFIDTIELIGDITGKGKTGMPIETTLKDVITAGTFGGATKTLTLTVDAKGRVTSVTENTISGTGLDGREVELSTSGDYIVWRYVGETIWNNLVLLSSLQGPAGTDGTNGTNGANGNDGLTPFVGGNGNWWIGTTDTGIAAQGNSSLPATIDSTTTNSDNGTTHTHELGNISPIVKSILGNNHESYLIENTTNISETVDSSWAILPYNEQVGEFKAVVMVRNKALNTIITLMNILSFDYSDAVKVVQQNPMLTDLNITLTVGVDAGTSKLFATVAGMTADNKRIHLCFERCVLSERLFDLEASMELTLEMAATITAYLNVSATFELNLDMQAVVSTYHNVSVSPEMHFDMIATPSFYRNLAASASMSLEMVAEVILQASETGTVDYALFYNLEAVNDARELAPTDWRIANFVDYMDLINFYGGEALAGGDMKILETWTEPNLGATANSKFKALPAGQRTELGEFSGKLTRAIFWIKTE